MRHVRPWQLFDKLEGNRDVVYRIPSHKGVESETIMSLETMLLIAAARIVKATSILELGTCLGYNAFNLARNLDANIDTVDKDQFHREKAWKGNLSAHKIVSVEQDILKDYRYGLFDLVFCDVNYSAETLDAATRIAFASNPDVIAWHDYGHPLCPHVGPYLDALAIEDSHYFHVEESWMVFWFKEPLL